MPKEPPYDESNDSYEHEDEEEMFDDINELLNDSDVENETDITDLEDDDFLHEESEDI